MSEVAVKVRSIIAELNNQKGAAAVLNKKK